MDQNMETLMDQNMERLQNSIESMLLHTLDERFPKSDILTQGKWENKENKVTKPQSHMGNILTHLENMKVKS